MCNWGVLTNWAYSETSVYYIHGEARGVVDDTRPATEVRSLIRRASVSGRRSEVRVFKWLTINVVVTCGLWPPFPHSSLPWKRGSLPGFDGRCYMLLVSQLESCPCNERLHKIGQPSSFKTNLTTCSSQEVTRPLIDPRNISTHSPDLTDGNARKSVA